MKEIKVEKTFSKGIVMGEVFVVEKQTLLPDTYTLTTEEDIEKEIKKYEDAVGKAKEQIEEIADQSDIFKGHLELVQDVALYEGIVSKIKSNKMNASQALVATRDEFCLIFDCMEDEYMRERSADVKDVCDRIMKCLKGIDDNPLTSINKPVIVVAEDLAPSDTAVMDLDLVKGFITKLGGVTSHVSIMARSMGIPALVGVHDILDEVKSGDFIIMDAAAGNIIINPDDDVINEYKIKAEEFKKQQEELDKVKDLPAVTLDGKTTKIYGNAGSIQDVKKAVEANVEGIGLFRSEFLYMENNDFPSEEEQFEVYKEAAELLEGKDLIIRTLDIGGDKSLPYYEFEEEENPFLGFRAIRISLELQNVFKTQLRAILRASAYGTVKVMYPMIISMEELIKANEILEICKQELSSEGIKFDENIQVGIMIETPAAVLCVENFAKHVDFFSIGTNDLTQYLLAVDRGNKKIQSLFNSYHPAVIQSIRRIIEAGHAQGIEVGMCGEFASDEKATKLLLGLGLDEFSVSASEVTTIKNRVRNLYYEEAKETAQKATSVYSIDEVMECLK